MIDITLVITPISEAAERELTDLDSTLNEIIALADHNQLLPAAERAEQLWKQRVYDVRLLGFFLFGAFLEQGIPALPRITLGLTTALDASWPHLGPVASKQRHCDTALRWLFTNILSQLRFHQRGQSAQWKQWLEQWTASDQEATLDAMVRLADSLEAVLPGCHCKAHLHSLQGMLRNFLRGTSAPPPGDANVEAAAASEPAREPLAASPPIALARAAEQTPMYELSNVLAIPLSPPMQLLLRKMAAFDRLVELSKWRQAAMVASDIRQALAAFDPRVYLPTLFAKFLSQLVANAKNLAQKDPDESLGMKALKELYHTDLDLFIAAKD